MQLSESLLTELGSAFATVAQLQADAARAAAARKAGDCHVTKLTQRLQELEAQRAAQQADTAALTDRLQQRKPLWRCCRKSCMLSSAAMSAASRQCSPCSRS
jgi:septal ring factor EnvC (AmiA/AmiB activator)